MFFILLFMSLLNCINPSSTSADSGISEAKKICHIRIDVCLDNSLLSDLDGEKRFSRYFLEALKAHIEDNKYIVLDEATLLEFVTAVGVTDPLKYTGVDLNALLDQVDLIKFEPSNGTPMDNCIRQKPLFADTTNFLLALTDGVIESFIATLARLNKLKTEGLYIIVPYGDKKLDSETIKDMNSDSTTKIHLEMNQNDVIKYVEELVFDKCLKHQICTDVPHVANADTSHCAGLGYGKDCDVHCDKHNIKKGSVICKGWLGWINNATCEPGCLTGPEIDNSDAKTVCNNTPIGDSCKITCSPGYFKNKDPTCTNSGVWSKDTSCDKVCPTAPPQIDFASKSLSLCVNTKVKTNCEFSCISGYARIGPLMCLESGLWDASQVSCKRCSDPPKPKPNVDKASLVLCKNTDVGSPCTYHCDSGYFTTFPLTCLPDATWSTDWSCEKGCVKPPTPTKNSIEQSYKKCIGTPVSKTCDFQCQDNYVKTEDLVCLSGSVWSRNSFCVRGCNKLFPPPPNVNLSSYHKCSRTRAGLTCDFSCLGDYVRDGVQRCEFSGKWSGNGTCQKGCKAAPSKQNFPRIDEKSVSGCAGMVHGKKCGFSCQEFYLPSNKSAITCGPPWTGSDVCEYQGCKKPPAKQTAAPLIDCQWVDPGKTCDIRCPSGKAQAGHVMCTGKEIWDDTAYCTTYCIHYPALINAKESSLKKCSDIANGTKCEFECKEGYHKYGKPIYCKGTIYYTEKSFCDKHGEKRIWSDYAFIVIAVFCFCNSGSLLYVVTKYVTQEKYFGVKYKDLPQDFGMMENINLEDPVIYIK